MAPTRSSEGLPLNVEVGVLWSNPDSSFDHRTAPVRVYSTTLRLRATDGAIVELEPSPTTHRFRPTEDLAPNTTYVVEDHTPSVPLDGCEASEEWTEVGSFTTGTERDDVAPATPTDGTYDSCCHVQECTDGACCGPWMTSTRSVQFTFEEGGARQYRVDGGEPVSDISPIVGFATRGMFGETGSVLPTIAAGAIEARAVDAAGNASAWTTALDVPACGDADRCGGAASDAGTTASDAGTTTASDAGTTTASDAGPSSSSSGCSVTPGLRASAPVGAGLVAGLAVALGLVRRRRARR